MSRQFVIVGITDGSGAIRYIEKGRLGPARYSWTGLKSRAKKFSNQSEPRRVAQDWIRPYEDRRVTVIVEEVEKSTAVTGDKNPVFGKRKTRKPKGAKPAKKVAPKFGKRKAKSVSVSGDKNPRGMAWVIRGVTRDGAKYFYNGISFIDQLSMAAFYESPKAAEKILDAIEDRSPREFKAVDIVLGEMPEREH